MTQHGSILPRQRDRDCVRPTTLPLSCARPSGADHADTRTGEARGASAPGQRTAARQLQRQVRCRTAPVVDLSTSAKFEPNSLIAILSEKPYHESTSCPHRCPDAPAQDRCSNCSPARSSADGPSLTRCPPLSLRCSPELAYAWRPALGCVEPEAGVKVSLLFIRLRCRCAWVDTPCRRRRGRAVGGQPSPERNAGILGSFAARECT